MQLTCVNQTLAEGLSRVGRAVSARATALPILGHVLLDATPETLTLAASNLEWHIVQRLPAQVATPGRSTAPAAALTEWVKTLPVGALTTLDLDVATLTLTVANAAATARFRGLDAAEFPLLPEPDAVRVEVEAAALRTALNRVAFAAAREAANLVLTAVLAQAEGSTLTLAAADGFRLSEAQVPLAAPVATPWQVLIPAPVLREAQRLLGTAETVTLSVTDLRDRLALRFDATTIVAQTLEGNYPDYRRVIPTRSAMAATVERQALLQACQRARVFARDLGGQVRLHLDADGLTLQAASAAGDAGSTALPVLSHQGDALEIAFCVDFLIDALQALDAPQVGLKFNGARQPGVIDLAAQPFVHTVMPLVG